MRNEPAHETLLAAEIHWQDGKDQLKAGDLRGCVASMLSAFSLLEDEEDIDDD